jgi:hypothetical protein
VFDLPAGAVGARWGVKETQLMGVSGSAAGTVILIAAAWMPPELRTGMLVGGWLLSWIAAAFSAVNSIPYLMAVTNDQNRSLAFTGQAVVMALTGFGGSLIAGVLPALLSRSFSLPVEAPQAFAAAMLPAPVAYLIGAFALTKGRRVAFVVHSREENEPSRPPLGTFAFLVLVIMLQAYGEGSVRAFFNVYLATGLDGTTDAIGALMGFGQLLPILFLLATPLALKRWKTATALGLAAVLSFLFMLLLAVPSWGAAAAAYIGVMGSIAMANTIRNIFSQEIVIPRWRTISSAITIVGMAVGWGSSAWIGGALVKSAGFQGVFILGAALTFISVGLLLARDQMIRQRAGKASLPAV